MAAGREDEALATLRRLSEGSRSDCPGYIHYLEGQLLMKRHMTAEAWKELRAAGMIRRSHPEAGGWSHGGRIAALSSASIPTPVGNNPDREGAPT